MVTSANFKINYCGMPSRFFDCCGLLCFAEKYLSRFKPDSSLVHGDGSRFPNANDNGFVGGVNSFGYQPLPKDEYLSFSAVPEPSRVMDPRLESSKKFMGSISALKELVRSK